ncbi:hypothetical protein [Arthrobacter rhombi]|uniref:hypothetical protein n=1 Tax=Arthrobacter rhombi TaxID=71253 RepID=UPI003F8EE505
MSNTPDPAQASQATAELNEKFTTLMPQLVERLSGAAEMKYKRVREESCLRAEEDEPQSRTAWIGWAVGPVADKASAERALDALDTQLADDGWDKENEVTSSAERAGSMRTLYYTKGKLGLTADLHRSTDRLNVDIKLKSRCVDQPTEHRMQRSQLDPGYGKNSQFYDDWK